MDKCIWVESLERATKKTVFGKEVTTALTGTVIQDMSIKHCGYDAVSFVFILLPTAAVDAPLNCDPKTTAGASAATFTGFVAVVS